jgi:hypothetical protein
MASLSGESGDNGINLTGENNGYFTDIYADNIITNQLQSQDINLFTGVTSNIQNQITSLTNQIVNGYTGGGFFALTAIQSSGFTAANYFLFGGGVQNAVIAPIQLNFNFIITAFQIRVNTSTATAAQIIIRINQLTVYTQNIPAAQRNTFIGDTGIDYVAGDLLDIFCVSGTGGGLVKITLSCQCNGVVGPAGATPTFSIGTVTSLPANTPSTVTQTGTQLLPILNFGIQQGNQGPQGIQGPKGDKGDKGDTGDGFSFTALEDFLDLFYWSQKETQYFIDFSIQEYNLLTVNPISNKADANATAIGVLTTGVAANATAIGLQQTEIDTVILPAIAANTTAITTANEEITTLQDTTQNIIIPTSPDITNFAGSIGANDVNTDTLEVTTTISGLASINLNSTSAIQNISGLTTTITGQTLTLTSNTGFGTCSLGNPSDAVFIQGIPFYAFLYSQWIP